MRRGNGIQIVYFLVQALTKNFAQFCKDKLEERKFFELFADFHSVIWKTKVFEFKK